MCKFKLLLDLPLYKKFEFKDEIKSYSDSLGTIDLYCIDCNDFSPFERIIYGNNNNQYFPSLPDSKIAEKEILLQCQRNKNHYYNFYFKINNGTIMKIGQYPSIADLEIHSIEKYSKVLSKDYRDFSKAIGLNSHGIGIGSFVYLRRIFENLIDESYQLALQEGKIDDELFQKSRMVEKIKLLKDFLPDILVENRQIYGILSKGIHELSEGECLDMFPKVKLAIELILDEKLAKREEASKVQQLKEFISSTVETLK